MLKAYSVYNRRDGCGEICFLTYAETPGKAKSYVSRGGWAWGFDEFIGLAANRRPEFDQYARFDKAHIIMTNEDLPDGVKFYLEEEDYA